jgi:hypothetical protein
MSCHSSKVLVAEFKMYRLVLLLLQQASKEGCGTRTGRSRIFAHICILMILHLEIQGQATLAASIWI